MKFVDANKNSVKISTFLTKLNVLLREWKIYFTKRKNGPRIPAYMLSMFSRRVDFRLRSTLPSLPKNFGAAVPKLVLQF